VKEFAKKHVPILKKHLELAEKTRNQVGSGKEKASSKTSGGESR